MNTEEAYALWCGKLVLCTVDGFLDSGSMLITRVLVACVWRETLS